MIKWIPYELHCHTNHSDGKQSLAQLGEYAKELGFYGFALTDHNTISPFKDIEFVKESSNINIINGLEWTTFFGHVLLLGAYQYYDWRQATLDNLDEMLEIPKSKGVLIGLAHPYRIGNPISTGCYMEYNIKNMSNIDYIEVWSGTNPGKQYDNKEAFKLWTKLLNEGYRIRGMSGRDWHKYDRTNKLISATYIGLEEEQENNNENILNAIKQGRITISSSVVLDMEVGCKDKTFNIGDTVYGDDSLKVNITISEGKVKNNFSKDDKQLMVKVNSNLGLLHEVKLQDYEKVAVNVDNSKNLKWMRAELYIDNVEEELIAFTNPVYF